MTTLEELLILLKVEVISSREVTPTCKLKRKLGVVKRVKSVGDESLFVYADAQHLTLLVYTDDTIRSFVFGSNKDSLSRNSVHVDASTRLQVVKVDETVLRDEVDDAVFLRYLHCHGEIVSSFRREINVDRLLSEWCIRGSVVNFYDMEL